MICRRILYPGVDILLLLEILVGVITEQTVHIVCGYLTYIDIVQLSYFKVMKTFKNQKLQNNF